MSQDRMSNDNGKRRAYVKVSEAPATAGESAAPKGCFRDPFAVGPRRVGITETAFRDAHQSIMATRLRTEDMIPIAEAMDQVGYHSMEVWGGATFDACMRFLDEDPWERLRELRRRMPNTKLQMLLRGQNLVGYRHYADDVVREFVKRAVGNGIDIIRIFDALNDLRNMEVAADQVKREGAHLQLAISYTISPVHTLESFVKQAEDMVSMGADSICIKDMAGLLSPTEAGKLVSAIKSRIGRVPLQVHSHYTSGFAAMTYLASIMAGADVVDCAISPFSMGTSQPATETMVAALAGGAFDTGLSLEKLLPVAEHFSRLREKYSKLIMGVQGVDINILIYQVPGGMYSNLQSQLKEQGALHKLREVLEEVPRVRKEMGYPPLVTPTSQIVGSQAAANVLVGERWKVVPKEVRQVFQGYYGRTPAPVDPEIQRKVLGDEEPITCRPGELLEPELERAYREVEPWVLQPEDVLSYVLFPQVAKDFLPRKYARSTLRDVGFEELREGAAYPV
ncbi:pyruvate carboxylase subunit B [Thermanaerovibrio acidaminovorans]|uniref:pyruvate carboxylase subunit B n=1 Tax=Thermanaerovibrio acidaminovorans TaxID=81462 RepID=UPI00249077A9|nr:pyruvate carboxylase subunit B [Thermanaerovibrio acidaminovorans]